MRLLHVRFSVKTLLVAIALVATLFGMFARRSRALALAELHESKTMLTGWACSRTRCQRFCVDRSGNPDSAKQIKDSEWHARLAAKYRLAANRPWLPVAPDPPEPR
jgi:hypothetical protein